MERVLSLAGNIEVVVQSWNHWQQRSTTTTAANPATGSASDVNIPAAQYRLMRPNLTPSDADSLAQRQLQQISYHEKVIEFQRPGELLVSPRDVIVLDGTGTAFDQSYYIETIERRISEVSGFIERVRAKGGSEPSAVGQ
jgi:hypothetical protein